MARKQIWLTLLTVCFLLTTHLTSGSQFVAAGLERAQAYADVCVSADPECSVHDDRIHLGENPSHTLNLFLHLTGVLDQLRVWSVMTPPHSSAPVESPASWVPRLMTSEIFHPPIA